MPKRKDIKSILIIGSGPIVIGQACEFDYSGTQACKALREEGYKVILVNSNPATIMTDPDFADVTYIEPLTLDILDLILEKENPDAILPTLGGQTALNLTIEIAEKGLLEKYNIELIGAKIDAIRKGEDRNLFKEAMIKIGLDTARSTYINSIEQAKSALEHIGEFPLIIRPSFTLGGLGGGVADDHDQYIQMVQNGLDLSPVNEILIEECLVGWKEYEMEVMRDYKDQCVVICSIENFDPMGIHTGDSITVAPAMTLTDKEYQIMRDASFACIREIGVETGGSNIQFAVNPKNGRLCIIEMNPRVSRSSALASKATGFPIAKLAAKLAVGYSLDEIQNDITQKTPACFEPTIDYVVTKIPRFTFEKFPGTDSTLTTSMKSVGEAMAIGSTFKESFQKALRSLEIGSRGFGGGGKFGDNNLIDRTDIIDGITRPSAERVFYLRYAFKIGMTVEEIHQHTYIDNWFLKQLEDIVALENQLAAVKNHDIDPNLLRRAKEYGFTDLQISEISEVSPDIISRLRKDNNIQTVFRLVDTCAAEFEAVTPYYYSSYGDDNEIIPSDKKKIMILGGGPNRIGQGIEFDYCCVHASFALQKSGFETVMVNSNPETVSTDYDISDRLYFEPLTLEDVLEIYHQENCSGAIVQFGGQTPLNLAESLKANGVNIIGTSPENINAAEDRKLFKDILNKLQLKQPVNDIAMNPEESVSMAKKIGYPILLRPSFVLGGRGMFIVYDESALTKVINEVFDVAPGKPVLLDKFLEDAIELDVDCISDGETSVIGGMLEHVEQAGVHSGDAAMALPPHSLSNEMLDTVRVATQSLARELKISGLMNVQYAIKNNELFVLEVNPRASRTVPFVSKAIGVPLAKLAALIMTGEKLKDLGFTKEIIPDYYSIKESVFPFSRYYGSTIGLSPEMRSTGEVMGIDSNFGLAFAKAQMAAGSKLPTKGNVFISVKDNDKPAALEIAKELINLGFNIFSTNNTAAKLKLAGLEVTPLKKVLEGHPNVVDLMIKNDVDMIINTPSGTLPRKDENVIRTESVKRGICIITTMTAAKAAVEAINSLNNKKINVNSLQNYINSKN